MNKKLLLMTQTSLSKKITIKILSFLSIFILFSSCNHTADEIPSIINNPNGDYFPTAINNSWLLKNSETEKSIKQIGFQDINGVTYNKLQQEDIGPVLQDGNPILGDIGDKQVLLRKNSGNYYVKVPDIPNGRPGYEYIVLKDNIPVNGTWSGSYEISYTLFTISLTQKINYTATILAKNTQETINGVIVKDIIKVRFVKTNETNNNSDWGTKEIWFAKNIGIVKYFTTYSPNGGTNFQSTWDLIDVKLY